MSTRVNSRCGLFIGMVRLRQSFLAHPRDGRVRRQPRMKVPVPVDIIDAVISTSSRTEGPLVQKPMRSLAQLQSDLACGGKSRSLVEQCLARIADQSGE